jgi:predicted ThiF/HesA family dinucleotide-utilizing enzyme
MWTWKAINSAGAWGGRNFPVQMRATPTVSLYNLTGNVNGASIAENGTNPVTTNTVTNPTNQGIQEISTTGTPWTANQAIIANLTASAEL